MMIYLEPSLKAYADSQSIKEFLFLLIGVLASEEGLGADSMTGGRTSSMTDSGIGTRRKGIGPE